MTPNRKSFDTVVSLDDVYGTRVLKEADDCITLDVFTFGFEDTVQTNCCGCTKR